MSETRDYGELVERTRAIGIYLAAQRGQASGIVLEAAAAIAALQERATRADARAYQATKDAFEAGQRAEAAERERKASAEDLEHTRVILLEAVRETVPDAAGHAPGLAVWLRGDRDTLRSRLAAAEQRIAELEAGIRAHEESFNNRDYRTGKVFRVSKKRRRDEILHALLTKETPQ